MSATEAAAWWGAAIATLVLIWDVYKWRRSGPQVRVCARADMQELGNATLVVGSKVLVVVEVVNIGDRPLEITKLTCYYYKNLLKRFLRKPHRTFLVPRNSLGPNLPINLKPGERWMGGIDQAQLPREIGTEGSLYCGVFSSSMKRPVLAKVDLEATRNS